jgi:uncharacterized delta-60 repeat protein
VVCERLEDRTLLDAGALDPTFAANAGTGRSLFDGGSQEGGAAVAFQGNKIVVAGSALIGGDYDIYLTRLNADGSLDTTFGFNGHVSTNIQGDDYGAAVVVQPDNKIVVVGTADAKSTNTTTRADMVVLRYNPNGGLDQSFNGSGYRRINFGEYDYGSGVALQGDRIVVVGTGTNPVSLHYDFSVARLRSDGSLDTTFGGTGMVQTNITSDPRANDFASAVAVDGSSIVVAGSANYGFGQVVDGTGYLPLGGTSADFAVVRYDYFGNLVSGFGPSGTGIVTTDFGGNDLASSVALLPDGRIVVVGATNFYATGTGNGTYTLSDASVAVAQYTANGQLDPSFNGNGRFTLNLTSGADVLSGVAVDARGPDWKIVAVGARNLVYGSTSADFLVLQLDANGQLDPDFGNGGTLNTGFADTVAEDTALGVGLQSDGRIFAVGTSMANGTADVAVARFENDAVQLAAPTFTAAANGGSASVTLTRTGGSTGSVTVQLATSDGSGRAGVDYQAVTQTVTFNSGETTKVVQVPLIDNHTVDGPRTVNLTLRNAAGGAVLGARTAAVLTITNDDQPPPPGPEGVVPRLVRLGKLMLVEVRSSAGVLRRTFGPYPGRVSALLRDVNHDGVLDLVLTISRGGKKRQLAFDGRTLAPLPVPKSKRR